LASTVFDSMDAPQLRRYLDFLLYHYRVVDAFWFLKTAARFDQATAEALNEEVWAEAGRLGARAIVQRLGVEQKGLTGFVQAQRLFPWCELIGYQIDQREDEVVITVPSCPVQRARLDRGLGEFSCREMHHREFASFAAEIDPHIHVECRYAPPDSHPDDCFCEWRFTLIDDSREPADDSREPASQAQPGAQ
jgi:hypothetical protein